MSDNIEPKEKKNKKILSLPVLPLRDVVVYPRMIMPIFVGREKSIEAVQYANDKGLQIALIMQKDPEIENPTAKDMYKVGTLGNILQMLRLPDGTVKILVEGIERIKVKDITDKKTFFLAEIENYPQKKGKETDMESWARAVISQFEEYVKLNKKFSPDVLHSVKQISEYDKLA